MCERKVSPPFVCFDKLFPLISEFIVLARWVKFNSLLMPGLVLIVLSGTESNRGIKFFPRLAIFNPGLAIIGFAGTGPDVCPRFSRYWIWQEMESTPKIEMYDRETAAQQFRGLVMSEIQRRRPWRYEFELSFVGNDRRPSEKYGTHGESRNAPDSPELSPSIPDDRGYLRFRVFISWQNLGQSGNSKVPNCYNQLALTKVGRRLKFAVWKMTSIARHWITEKWKATEGPGGQGCVVLAVRYKRAEHFRRFAKKKIMAELLPEKHSKNSRKTTRWTTFAVWRISAELSKHPFNSRT